MGSGRLACHREADHRQTCCSEKTREQHHLKGRWQWQAVSEPDQSCFGWDEVHLPEEWVQRQPQSIDQNFVLWKVQPQWRPIPSRIGSRWIPRSHWQRWQSAIQLAGAGALCFERPSKFGDPPQWESPEQKRCSFRGSTHVQSLHWTLCKEHRPACRCRKCYASCFVRQGDRVVTRTLATSPDPAHCSYQVLGQPH